MEPPLKHQTWFAGHRAPNRSAFVDKLHREDRDERVQKCLGETLWMAGEIIVHDHGPEFMGNEFQNPAGAAGVLTTPIESQSPWQNGKTERAGQSFKHQLWDLDEECHIAGETEFEAAVAECCDARNRYCNRSSFSAHQRVFGSSLRLPGSLLSDDPIDRQLLTADPYTNFHRASVVQTKNLHVRYKPQD